MSYFNISNLYKFILACLYTSPYVIKENDPANSDFMEKF